MSSAYSWSRNSISSTCEPRSGMQQNARASPLEEQPQNKAVSQHAHMIHRIKPEAPAPCSEPYMCTLYTLLPISYQPLPIWSILCAFWGLERKERTDHVRFAVSWLIIYWFLLMAFWWPRFIIKLFETYNGTQSLYFLLEPALGGLLLLAVRRKTMFQWKQVSCMPCTIRKAGVLMGEAPGEV